MGYSVVERLAVPLGWGEKPVQVVKDWRVVLMGVVWRGVDLWTFETLMGTLWEEEGEED